MNYKILTLKEKEEWTTYFSKLPKEQQDIYYTPEYYYLYEQNGDGIANCFVFEMENKIALYPFLKNSINDLEYQLENEFYDIQGAYGYNGVVSSCFNKEFISKFYETFNLYCSKNNIVCEFLRFNPVLENSKFSDINYNLEKDRETVVIDLKLDYNEIWEKEYSSTNRNMIRKSIKLGYHSEILENPSKKQLNSFIDVYLYSMQMANAEKYFFFKNEYYESIFNNLCYNTFLLNILNANNELVCSSILFQYGEYFHYHLSGRNEKADNSVNNYLLDRAIDFSKSKNGKCLHLGGGRSTKNDDTLLKFKKNFSKKTLDFYIGKKIHNQKIYDIIVDQWSKRTISDLQKYSKILLKYRVLEH